MRRTTAALVLSLGVVAGGCERETAAPMEREQFVEVMVSLRRASQEAGSQANFDARRAAILEQAGVTEAQLRAYARQAPAYARELVEAYDSIAAQLQRYHEPE
jgi:hypothetical protein